VPTELHGPISPPRMAQPRLFSDTAPTSAGFIQIVRSRQLIQRTEVRPQWIILRFGKERKSRGRANGPPSRRPTPPLSDERECPIARIRPRQGNRQGTRDIVMIVDEADPQLTCGPKPRQMVLVRPTSPSKSRKPEDDFRASPVPEASGSFLRAGRARFRARTPPTKSHGRRSTPKKRWPFIAFLQKCRVRGASTFLDPLIHPTEVRYFIPSITGRPTEQAFFASPRRAKDPAAQGRDPRPNNVRNHERGYHLQTCRSAPTPGCTFLELTRCGSKPAAAGSALMPGMPGCP